jgi:hypothetical protein
MTRHDGFQRGSGNVFDCACCGRKARETKDTGGSGYCSLCYELMGLDNEVNDGATPASKHAKRAAEILAEIAAKGGNVERVKSICNYVCKGL